MWCQTPACSNSTMQPKCWRTLTCRHSGFDHDGVCVRHTLPYTLASLRATAFEACESVIADARAGAARTPANASTTMSRRIGNLRVHAASVARPGPAAPVRSPRADTTEREGAQSTAHRPAGRRALHPRRQAADRRLRIAPVDHRVAADAPTKPGRILWDALHDSEDRRQATLCRRRAPLLPCFNGAVLAPAAETAASRR